jgi:hypothetical protein
LVTKATTTLQSDPVLSRLLTQSNSKNANLTLSNRETAFILVVKQAAFAKAGAAIIAIELVAVSNVIPAFAAFYGSIDELKHHTFRFFRAA